jgi:tetratricopeptide (TPR) repeat protein
MILLKTLVCLALMVLPPVLVIRDWKYYDRRTRWYRQVTQYILIAWFLFAIANAVLFGIGERERSGLSAKVEELIAGKNILISQNQELITQNLNLQTSITSYQNDLTKKEVRIKELELQAKMISRGVASTYDFNGAKRETAGGRIKFTVGPEVEIFNQMQILEQSGGYGALIDLCKQQIEKTPGWLTPYLFAGVAYLKIGEKDKAATYLRQVAENAPRDPNYAEAEKLLQQLRPQP